MEPSSPHSRTKAQRPFLPTVVLLQYGILLVIGGLFGFLLGDNGRGEAIVVTPTPGANVLQPIQEQLRNVVQDPPISQADVLTVIVAIDADSPDGVWAQDALTRLAETSSVAETPTVAPTPTVATATAVGPMAVPVATTLPVTATVVLAEGVTLTVTLVSATATVAVTATSAVTATAVGPAPTVAPATATRTPCVHVVEVEENLFRIALLYDTTSDVLMALNALSSEIIFANQVLEIPRLPNGRCP